MQHSVMMNRAREIVVHANPTQAYDITNTYLKLINKLNYSYLNPPLQLFS